MTVQIITIWFQEKTFVIVKSFATMVQTFDRARGGEMLLTLSGRLTSFSVEGLGSRLGPLREVAGMSIADMGSPCSR